MSEVYVEVYPVEVGIVVEVFNFIDYSCQPDFEGSFYRYCSGPSVQFIRTEHSFGVHHYERLI